MAPSQKKKNTFKKKKKPHWLVSGRVKKKKKPYSLSAKIYGTLFL